MTEKEAATEQQVASEAADKVYRFLSTKIAPETVADAMMMMGIAGLACHLGRTEVAEILHGLADRMVAPPKPPSVH